ncbi:hypothetical protein HAX54_007060 [Datura stramonium]|uniref:Uncharacterized protein n=1 Tax=Datura stramonium TaxID=4076 RepID=A0ABS8TBZ2_DATST|nr:hypothetical protein [Datura stramonium]
MDLKRLSFKIVLKGKHLQNSQNSITKTSVPLANNLRKPYMDYNSDEAGACCGPNSTVMHIANVCLVILFSVVICFCLMKCYRPEVKVSPSELPTSRPRRNAEQPPPVADQHENSTLVILPGERNPTCIATPVCSPHRTPDV